MSYIVKHRVGNRLYAYEVASVWDKQRKMPVQRVVRYLGPVGEDGKVRERLRKPLSILDYGDVATAKSVFEETSLPALIERLPFGEKEKQLIELMVLNRVVMPQPDYLLQDWVEGNYLSRVYEIPLDSREVSRMLRKIGRKDIAEVYFEAVKEVVKIKDVVAYDLTHLPTSIDLILSEWGRSGSGTSKIVKLAVLFDVVSKMPLYFRLIAGNVREVSTLASMLENIRFSLPKSTNFCMILDRGFYSSLNLQMLKKMRMDFVIPVPRTTSLFHQMVGKNKNIVKARNQFLLNGKYHYGTKSKHDMCLIYVFYSPQKFIHDVEMANRMAVSGVQLDKKLGTAGYTVIASTLDEEPKEILKRYYQRYYLEKSYSYLKSKVDMLPLRHHSEETTMAHVFISTLSLSLYWILHERLMHKYSLERAFLILRRIKAKIYSSDRVFLTEIGKKEREILKMVGVNIVTKICGK
jgi:transposase